MQTDGLKLQEQQEDEQQQVNDKSFWEKFLDLFKQ